MDDSNGVNIVVRPFEPEQDQALVYSTWRNSMFYGIDHLRKQPNAAQVFKNLTRDIKETLKTAEVLVACLEDSPDTIIGYSVFTKNHLNWCYVKEDYRRQGVATLLIPDNIKTYTDKLTKIARSILEKKQKENKNAEEEARAHD